MNNTAFGQYVLTMINWFNTSCNDGTFGSYRCNLSDGVEFAIWNEAFSSNWTVAPTGSKYAQMYSEVLRVVRFNSTNSNQYAVVGTGALRDLGTAYIDNFFSALNRTFDPAFMSIHSYSIMCNADPTCVDYAGDTVENIINQTDTYYLTTPSSRIDKIRSYNSSILFYNEEYNMDSDFDPMTEVIRTQAGAAWLGSALSKMVISNLSKEIFFEGTNKMVGTTSRYGMWEANGSVKYNIAEVHKQFTSLFPKNTRIYYHNKSEDSVDVVSSDEALVLTNILNSTITVNVVYSNGVVNTLTNSSGFDYSSNNNTFAITLQPWDVQFLTLNANQVQNNFVVFLYGGVVFGGGVVLYG